MTPASSPLLQIKEINDTYIQGNFKNLREYFNKQNQLLNFVFVEFNFPAAVTNQKIAHSLGLIPQDVIITRITGAGTATLNWGLFDASNLDVTTTGACRIRLFVGSYWNFQTSLANGATDKQAVAATPSTTTTAAAAATTSTAFAMPPGAMMPYAGATAPSGWLLCDGSAVSRVLFPALFTALSNGAIWGTGDGSTTFNVPNSSGVFLRGAGTQTISAIATPTIALGAVQGDQFQDHAHPWGLDIGNVTNGSNTVSAAAFNHSLALGGPAFNGTVNANAGAALSPTATGGGTPRIGSETRPANIGVNYIIKT